MQENADLALGPQALKSKKTREKILRSAISLIKESGLSAASASRIAERAGITWGAAQHHFGSKDEVLDAVMVVSHENFTELMSTPLLREGTLADRVDRFVDLMWRHYQGDIYLAAMEILLASRDAQGGKGNISAFERQAREHIRTLREIFFDSELNDDQIQEALIFTHCFLTGLSIERLLERDIRHIQRHIRRTKLILLTILSGV